VRRALLRPPALGLALAFALGFGLAVVRTDTFALALAQPEHRAATSAVGA
jgi:hypothetical protein